MTIDIEKLAQDMFGTVLVNGKEYYEIDSEEWKNLAEAYAAKVHDKRVEELEREIAELKAKLKHETSRKHINALQANINDLREALEEIEIEAYKDQSDLNTIRKVIEISKEALTKTPPQSLQEHDNEVIEMCAKVCDERVEFFGCVELHPLHERERDTAKDLASQIRALKEQI